MAVVFDFPSSIIHQQIMYYLRQYCWNAYSRIEKWLAAPSCKRRQCFSSCTSPQNNLFPHGEAQ
jgi:hypothetical protein